MIDTLSNAQLAAAYCALTGTTGLARFANRPVGQKRLEAALAERPEMELVMVDGQPVVQARAKAEPAPALEVHQLHEASDWMAPIVEAHDAAHVSADTYSERRVALLTALEAAYRAGLAAGAVKPRAAKAPKAPGTKREGNKRLIVAELLLRPEGATTREMLDATGWPAISVPATAKASGLILRKDKPEGATAARYYGTRA